MRSHRSEKRISDDRYLLIDDTDEDATEILTIVTDGHFRSSRRYDELRALGQGGAA